MEKKTQTTYFVPALAKALDVIEYLSRKTEPLPLSVIAKDLKRTSSELFRIMDYLVQRNYVIKEPNLNSYTLSLKFFELTVNISLIRRIVEASSQVMTELSIKTGCSSHISVVEGGYLIVLHEAESVQPYSLHVRVGARIPATTTSSGCLILSRMNTADRYRALSLDPLYSTKPLAEKEKILKKIQTFAEQDVCTNQSFEFQNVIDIFTAIELYHGKYAALLVPVLTEPRTDIPFAQIEANLKTTASLIQKRFTRN